MEYLSEGLLSRIDSSKTIISKEENLSASYSCVKKYVRRLKKTGIYIPPKWTLGMRVILMMKNSKRMLKAGYSV